MNHKYIHTMLITLACAMTVQAQAPSIINYQGRLVSGTNLVSGTVGLTLRLFNAPSGGALLYADSNQVAVVDGLYATYIGDGTIFGDIDTALTNSSVWLEAVVNGAVLTPRERLVSVPYARSAYGVTIGQNASVTMGPFFSGNKAGGAYSVVGGGVGNTIDPNSLSATIGGGNYNAIESNATHAVISGGANNFVRSNAFAATIGGGVANEVQRGTSASTVGGGYFNRIGPLTIAGMIGGGMDNRIESNTTYTTIGGGGENIIYQLATNAVISGGYRNTIGETSEGSVIGGGNYNTIQKNTGASVINGGLNNTVFSNTLHATIGGGLLNRIEAGGSTISGGSFNQILPNAFFSAIGGGVENIIGNNAYGATIPGGTQNRADGVNSFAAGKSAQALHDGSFVWSSLLPGTFNSSATNQFLVRADFVGINRNNPITSLEAFGITADFGPGSFGGMYIETPSTNGMPFYGYSRNSTIAAYHYVDQIGNWALVNSGPRLFVQRSNGFVGIGTTAPTNRLHVAGNVTANAFVTSSDRNNKENIRPVSPEAILEKVVALPVSTWSFKDEPSGTHIGPMAQDFYSAFGLGNTDTGITTVDADGVALAAIQALAAENARLREELEAIKRKLGM